MCNSVREKKNEKNLSFIYSWFYLFSSLQVVTHILLQTCSHVPRNMQPCTWMCAYVLAHTHTWMCACVVVHTHTRSGDHFTGSFKPKSCMSPDICLGLMTLGNGCFHLPERLLNVPFSSTLQFLKSEMVSHGHHRNMCFLIAPCRLRREQPTNSNSRSPLF